MNFYWWVWFREYFASVATAVLAESDMAWAGASIDAIVNNNNTHTILWGYRDESNGRCFNVVTGRRAVFFEWKIRLRHVLLSLCAYDMICSILSENTHIYWLASAPNAYHAISSLAASRGAILPMMRHADEWHIRATCAALTYSRQHAQLPAQALMPRIMRLLHSRHTDSPSPLAGRRDTFSR